MIIRSIIGPFMCFRESRCLKMGKEIGIRVWFIAGVIPPRYFKSG